MLNPPKNLLFKFFEDLQCLHSSKIIMLWVGQLFIIISSIIQCQWVVAAIKQLHRLAKGMFNSRHGHKDQQQIAELQKQFDLLRVTSATLAKLVQFSLSCMNSSDSSTIHVHVHV